MLSIMGGSVGKVQAADPVAGITATPAPLETAAITPTEAGTDIALNFDSCMPLRTNSGSEK